MLEDVADFSKDQLALPVFLASKDLHSSHEIIVIIYLDKHDCALLRILHVFDSVINHLPITAILFATEPLEVHNSYVIPIPIVVVKEEHLRYFTQLKTLKEHSRCNQYFDLFYLICCNIGNFDNDLHDGRVPLASFITYVKDVIVIVVENISSIPIRVSDVERLYSEFCF